VAPILFGFRTPTTEWLPLSPWWGAAFALVIATSFVALRSRSVPPFFHVLLVVVPVVFVASGSFVDAQSYRYAMTLFAALPVVLALGIDTIARWSRAAAIAALIVLVGLFATEQRAWYGRLQPDTTSAAILECLDRHAVRGAFADYWLSYKVTFLAQERV